MARDKVVKVEILCHSHKRRSLLGLLEKTGRVHLIDMADRDDIPLQQASSVPEQGLAGLGASIEKAIGFLQELHTDGKLPAPGVYTEEELLRLLSDEELVSRVGRLEETADRLAALSAETEDLRSRVEFAMKWSDLPMDFDGTGAGETVTVKAGHVSSRQGTDPLKQIEREQPLFHCTQLDENRMVVAWHRSVEESVLSLLTEAGFTPTEFENLAGSPEECIEELTSTHRQLEDKRDRLTAEARESIPEMSRLKALADAMGMESFRAAAASSGRASSHALLLHAWMRESDVPGLEASLGKLGEAFITVVEHGPEETPPVHLSESATADPYLMLTDMYGRPTGADPDPTPHMAPFYAMFFGICIGDAGYGLALAAGSAAGWHLTKKRQGNTRLFRLLFQGGLASIFWGILLGGWFGMAQERLPGLLQAAAAPLNSLVPGGYSTETGGFSLSNQFLYLTLVFGVIQLAWGIVVNLKKRLRAGEGAAAFIDQAGWMLALMGLFPWLFNHYLFSIYPGDSIIDSVLLGMLGAGALLIFVMGGREASNIGGKVGLGAYACYGIVNLLGDVLSYSRLFALALSSAIIASVINQMAGMLTGSIPVLGVILAVVVLAAGHLFNLAMAVLSGFIHTARLQFVEFFGKFYDGTGAPFSPLRYEPRYVRISR